MLKHYAIGIDIGGTRPRVALVPVTFAGLEDAGIPGAAGLMLHG
jgi:hypothetical protein